MFTEYTDDEGNVQTVEAQKTAYDTRKNNELAVAQGSRAGQVAKETDHYGLSDVTMSTEMTTYRQALRDVPSADAFQHN